MKNKKILVMLGLMAVVLMCCKVNKGPVSANANNKADNGSTSINTGNKPKPTLVPDSGDVVIAQTHWSGITLLNLNQGYAIFSDKCTDCHGIKKPQDFSVDDWDDILPKMGRKAHLDSNQYKLVYHYILTKREAMLATNK